ncbi:hypothetical protein ACQ3I4_09540 [Zafaria sp. Z1313]|uniref:hypothetical protein n=1 Tax=unclassified Zafaria TaxID=2828765 RepID=UPI002E774257|nr:hypothetical protein [Zafaria sp. J156]MEE1621839.1 hypothetical protein [Zafaria sp. J156]
MSPILTGLAVAAVLGWAALSFGFGGFLLMALFLAVGAAAGRFAEGRLDLRGIRDLLTGRRSSS